MKISEHQTFPSNFKHHITQEWNGRMEKLKEAHKLLSSFNINSIIELDTQSIEAIIQLMLIKPELEEGFELLKQSPITLRERNIVEKIQTKYKEIAPSEEIVQLIRTSNSNNFAELTKDFTLEQKCKFYTKAQQKLEAAHNKSTDMYVSILISQTLQDFKEKTQQFEDEYHAKLHKYVSTKLQSLLGLISDTEHTSTQFLEKAKDNLDTVLPYPDMAEDAFASITGETSDSAT